ncbi:ribosome silencing factor [Legionella fairfieldensis]|uniref:ribosome silencing factor n=1 Tax=Legionella fairfieldensis TaxID=45064 RepID=UPI00048FEFC9|nr:ribosome silencing factor [Legionella fairfieldensis]
MLNQPLFLKELLKSLDDNQAIDVQVIDVKDQTSVTDYMIIGSGRSSRQVKAIAEHVIEHMKTLGLAALSQTGLESGEWALIDFGDFVLHVMQPDSRAFYNLEGLWQHDSVDK